MRLSLFTAAFVAALFASLPLVAAETPAAAPAAPAAKSDAAAPAAATAGDPAASDARVARMRDRWRKMTPEQREDMRKKAARRLEERYERLSPQEQLQVNGLMDQVNKMSREQRSIFLAKVHQKAYQERTQRRLMDEQELKASGPAGSAPAAATPTASPTLTVTSPPAAAKPAAP